MNNWRWLLLIGLPLFFATGCWDRRDPEDREYVITMGIDKAEKGYSFTFAPAKTREKEPKLITAEGETLAGALASADSHNSRKTELGQLKMIVFGRELLEDRTLFTAMLAELEQSRDVSRKLTVLATNQGAADCVDWVLQEDNGTGLFLWDFYKNTAKEVAVTKGLDLGTFLTELSEQEGSAVLPRIVLEGEEIQLAGGIGLLDYSYLCQMEERTEQGYLFLLGEAEGALLEGHDGERLLPLRIVHSDVRYEFIPQTENRLLCRIILPLEGTLLGGSATQTSAQAKKMENLFAEIIKSEIENTINIARAENGENLYGLASRLRRVQPDFDGDFWQSVVFSVEPQLKIRNTGRIR